MVCAPNTPSPTPPKAEPNYAAQALFKAAKIAFSRKNPLEAERLFQLLISKYPKDPLAPPAAYWRIYSFQSRDDEILAERETWLLVDKYPNTRYAIDALFNLAAHYADSGSAPRANAVLDDLLKRVKSDPLKAKVLLEKALLAFKSGENAAALSLLDQLYSRYPNVPALPEVYYLNADILRKNGDIREQLRLLTHQRFSLLSKLHAAQQKVDCLDYLVFQIKQENSTKSRRQQ